jgi:toxin ParE1/3/4
VSYYFHPGAEAEHLESIAFFESRQKGLGVAYLAEFEGTMATVVQMPQRCRVERKPNLRSVSLARFPFKIIFRDVEGMVQILAVSHKRRRPDYWLNRL